jgi:hypothetical protein
MTIKNKILKFRSFSFVRLILILILILPAGVVSIAGNDYSGKLKIENFNSNKPKPFVGYHFLKWRRQLICKLKNKLSYNDKTLEFGRNMFHLFKTQQVGFLSIKKKLNDFLLFIFMSIDKDVEKLTVT